MCLLWNPWRGIPKTYRIYVAMPPLPQLKAAPRDGSLYGYYDEQKTRVVINLNKQ